MKNYDDMIKDEIKTQKRVADLMMDDIHKWTGKTVMVAGGAPRDWTLGKMCDDIDIYMESNTEVSNRRFKVFLQFMLEDAGYTLASEGIVQVGQDALDYGYNLPEIIGVFELRIDTGTRWQRVQIIRMSHDVPNVHYAFPVSISQAAYTINRQIKTSFTFDESIRNKVVYFDSQRTRMEYLSKLMSKESLYGFAFAPMNHKVALEAIPF